MKLTVIIPVYSVEATLGRCVESVVGQAFDDMEIILVNDGSPDGCPAMCDAWATKGSRVRVIHKANGGLSDARNAALEVAQGEFVTFVDSDDYLAPDTYAQVMAQAEGNDITEFPLFRHYGSQWQQVVRFGCSVYESAGDYWLRGRAYEHSYAWNKIYRRELFDGVRFPKGKVFEDVYTLPRLLDNARRIATVDCGMYYYCYNGQGITATAQGRQLGMLLEAHEEVINRWCDDRYYMHVLNIQADVYELAGRAGTGSAPTLPYRRVNPLAKGLSASQRLKALTLIVLGLENTCKLNKILHRWKKPTHS